MVNRAGLANEDMEFVQFHPTGKGSRAHCYFHRKIKHFVIKGEKDSSISSLYCHKHTLIKIKCIFFFNGLNVMQ